ncbi:hypothetical protein PAL_GLEAN10016037 [Pteropus alecto]|uniref:Uncharacterized protein n=1 Tax=Pteropus alecto TaxID=9402 RepID=L5JVY0_PTEAL|nr:hypothetical protein PAL_GLEAN10016037 [Pteropus alecto]
MPDLQAAGETEKEGRDIPVTSGLSRTRIPTLRVWLAWRARGTTSAPTVSQDRDTGGKRVQKTRLPLIVVYHEPGPQSSSES